MVAVAGGHVSAMVWIRRSEDSLWEPILASHPVIKLRSAVLAGSTCT